MNPRLSPAEISGFLERVLLRVQSPSRYTGGEWNSIVKDWDATPHRVALAFPDIYDLGMSNLGLAILYDLINKRPDMLAERVYAPWIDMEAELRAADVPLYGLETRHALSDFDVIGFSLPYEQLYTNVLNMLDLAGLPLRAADRGAEHPLILAGGSGCYNPEPMSAFFDAMVIGEGEEVIVRGCQMRMRRWKCEIGGPDPSSAPIWDRRSRSRSPFTAHPHASLSGAAWRKFAASTCHTSTP